MQLGGRARWTMTLLVGGAAAIWLGATIYPDHAYSIYSSVRGLIAATGSVQKLPLPGAMTPDDRTVSSSQSVTRFVVLPATAAAKWIAEGDALDSNKTRHRSLGS
jgi:hypothetical protein